MFQQIKKWGISILVGVEKFCERGWFPIKEFPCFSAETQEVKNGEGTPTCITHRAFCSFEYVSMCDSCATQSKSGKDPCLIFVKCGVYGWMNKGLPMTFQEEVCGGPCMPS